MGHIDSKGEIYEWHDAKRESNLKKHGIDFVAAVPALEDKYAIEVFDEDHSDDEARHQIIGEARPGILFVVFTMRGDDEDIYRIISARLATSQEKARYQAHRLQRLLDGGL